MANCAVSGTVLDPGGNGVEGVTVRARVETPAVATGGNITAPSGYSTETDANGDWTLTLPQQSTVIIGVQFNSPTSEGVLKEWPADIPALATANFDEVI